uniref:Uncharacterized protein n=1 Tax=Anopheles atroparvus TaxID=41427 RepID=A0A182IZJ2_ANOAO
MYPSSVICRLRVKRLTSASSTLLLAVAPPAQSRPRKQYDDTLDAQMPRLSVAVPEEEGPQRRNAAFQKRISPIRAGTCSIESRPPRAGSRRASIPRQSSSEGLQLMPPSPRKPRVDRSLVAKLGRNVVYHQVLLVHLPHVGVLIGEDAQQEPALAVLGGVRHHDKIARRQRKERRNLAQVRQRRKVERHLLADVLGRDALHPRRHLHSYFCATATTTCAFEGWPGGTRIRNCGLVAVVSMNRCGPPALNPARHWRTASAARQGARVCRPGSSAQSSGPMCASQMTTKRVRNSFTDIQNSQSFDEREERSSRSRSFRAFHSQLRSDQAPHQTPPHSPPIQGLRSRIRLVSPDEEPLPCVTESVELARTRASPVTQYGCSRRPEDVRLGAVHVSRPVAPGRKPIVDPYLDPFAPLPEAKSAKQIN